MVLSRFQIDNHLAAIVSEVVLFSMRSLKFSSDFIEIVNAEWHARLLDRQLMWNATSWPFTKISWKAKLVAKMAWLQRACCRALRWSPLHDRTFNAMHPDVGCGDRTASVDKVAWVVQWAWGCGAGPPQDFCAGIPKKQPSQHWTHWI